MVGGGCCLHLFHLKCVHREITSKISHLWLDRLIGFAGQCPKSLLRSFENLNMDT